MVKKGNPRSSSTEGPANPDKSNTHRGGGELGKFLLLLMMIFASGVACRLSAEPPPTPTPTWTAIPTFTPTQTPIPTPTRTPTPLPLNLLLQADQALFYGDWDAALNAYQDLFESPSDEQVHNKALLGIGRTYFAAGDYANTLNSLRQLIDLQPGTAIQAEAYFTLGQTFDLLQRYQEAAAAYQMYLTLKPGILDDFVLEKRGDALTNAGEYEGAILAYQSALSVSETLGDLSIEIKIAQAHTALGDHTTALSIYEELFNRAGDDYTKAQLDLLRGNAFFALGQSEEAYQSYLHAVENYPLSYNSYLGLVTLVDAGVPVNELDRGLVDYFAGQYGVAIAALDRYLASNPDEFIGTAHYYKGLAFRRLSNYTAALGEWENVIQNYPADPNWDNAWEKKADTLWIDLDQYGEAIQTLVDFVNLNPTHPRAAEFLFDAGRITERNGDLGRAAQIWERIALEYPTSPTAFQALFLSGIAWYRLNEIALARETFQRTLGLAVSGGERAKIEFWIGKSEERQGEEIAARAAWERSALADPTGYYSERARDILLGREPFSPPLGFDTVIDWEAERADAEWWIKRSFNLPEDANITGLGPLAENLHIKRGAELWNLGLYTEAKGEFERLRVDIQSDPVLTYRLANYLHELGLYRSAIFATRRVLDLTGLDDAGTLTAPRYFNHIRFGTYFDELVNPLAEAYDFHPLFIFSVMRQESLFEGFIRSSAGARGLMQIIPSTGQLIYELNNWPADYSSEDLYRPKVSVTFGVDHLWDLRAAFDGDLYAVLAGYNAGQGNASIWKSLSFDDQDLFLEIIRFEETHRYIKAIYEIFSIYRRIYDRSP